MAGDRRLAGWSALVTGASRGIGLACARALAGAGARVLMLARHDETLRGAARDAGPACEAIVADLGDPDQVAAAIASVRERLDGAPDILVNSAGQFLLAPVERTDVRDFDRLVLVNLTAPFALVRAFLPDLRRRGRGHVVTIGSLADHEALPENAAYAASKFGLRGLHGVLRAELRGSGVRATLISPEHVDTAIWEAAPSPDAGAGHMIQPADVAAAALYAVTAPPEVNVDELRLSRA